MNAARRKEIEAYIAMYIDGYSGETVAAAMLRDLLDELDLREKQIAIAHHMLCQISGELGTIGNELEGIKSDSITTS